MIKRVLNATTHCDTGNLYNQSMSVYIIYSLCHRFVLVSLNDAIYSSFSLHCHRLYTHCFSNRMLVKLSIVHHAIGDGWRLMFIDNEQLYSAEDRIKTWMSLIKVRMFTFFPFLIFHRLMVAWKWAEQLKISNNSTTCLGRKYAELMLL